MSASTFKSGIQIGPNMAMTPHGYLICYGVPIARTGTLMYRAEELGGDVAPGPDGIVRIVRNEDEVFSPIAMASFEHTAVTLDHPDMFVLPTNWKGLAVGMLQNVRRGSVGQEDTLLADMLVTDQAAIDVIKGGQREVSCGYNSDYDEVRPGLGVQRNIRGNHVALVAKGRCGPSCSIRDKAPENPITEEPAMTVAPKTSAFKLSIRDKILKAFHTKDEDALTAALAEEAGETVAPAAQRVEIIVNDKAAGTPVETKDAAITSLDARMTALEGGMAKVLKFVDRATKDADDDDKDDDKKKKTEDRKTRDDDDDDKDKKETKDSKTKDSDDDKEKDKSKETKDSDDDDDDEDKKKDKSKETTDRAMVLTEWQATVAKAEILHPGIKAPTHDKAMTPVKMKDSLCAFRRGTLEMAFTTEAGKAAITPFMPAGNVAFKDMSCKDAAVIFNGAAEVARVRNNTTGRATMDYAGLVGGGVPTASERNAKNRDFWKTRGGS